MSKKIIFAGLPSSGKTTFIAALWYFLRQENNKGSLSLTSISGENEYLNDICESWIKYKSVSRTNPKSETLVSMNIKNNLDNETAILEIPDFSGEVFRDHFDLREWSLVYDKLLDEISGIILFINPTEEKNRPKFIGEENKILRIFGEDPIEDSSEKENFHVDFVPHQVKLVEALQFIDIQKRISKPLKISIVISAWDLVINNSDSKYFSPVKWVASNLPLLFQYIECNADTFNVEFFGVSAQGGDYNASNINDLMTKKPEERILVREEDVTSNDIAKPILWTLK